MATHFSILVWRTPQRVWKGKKIWRRKMSPPVQKVSKMLLGKAGGKLVIAPVRMKWLGQSRNDAQLWRCLVVKIKPNALKNSTASQVALVVKKPPANAGGVRDSGWSLGQEDPLEEGMATHCSILVWRIPWTEELGRSQSIRSQRAGHDWSNWHAQKPGMLGLWIKVNWMWSCRRWQEWTSTC